MCHEGSKQALHHTHGLVGCLSRGGQPLVTQHCHSEGRDVPASQYLGLHWLNSPLIHHPALDLKERNGINHPAGHTARLPSPCGGSYVSPLPLPGVFPCGILVPLGGWAQVYVKKEELLCFSLLWKPKTSPRTPSVDAEDIAEGPSGTLPAGTAIPHSDHSCTCPHLRSHTLPQFSDA